MSEFTSNQRRLARYLLYIPVPCFFAYAAYQADELQSQVSTVYSILAAICALYIVAIASVEKQFGLRKPTKQDVLRFLFGYFKITLIMGLLEACSARDISHVLPAMGVYWAFSPFILPMLALNLPRLGEYSQISPNSC